MSLEDLGFNIDDLNKHARRVVRRARRVQRQALRHPDQHQPEEHGLVPEGRLRRRRLQGAEDVGRADRAERQDQGRRQHAVVRRLRERGLDRLARHRLDGRHHAPDRGSRRLRQVGEARDPVQRSGGEDGRPRRSARSCSRRATCSAARRNTPDIAFGDAPLPMFDNPPKCWLHRQASFINAFFPKTAKAGVDYDWFPFPPIDQEGTLCRRRADRRRQERQPARGRRLPQAVHRRGRPVQDGWRRGLVAHLAERRTSATTCYANEHPGRRLGGAHHGAQGRHRPVRRLRPDAGGGRAAAASGPAWSSTCRADPSSLDGVLNDIEDSWPQVAVARDAETSRRPTTGHEPSEIGRTVGTPTPRRGRAWRGATRLAVVAVLVGVVARRSAVASFNFLRDADANRFLVVGVAIVVGVGGVFAAVLGDEPVSSTGCPSDRAKACGRTCSSGRRSSSCRVFLDLSGHQHDPDQLQGRAIEELRRARQLQVRVHRREHAAVDPQHARSGSCSSRSSR